MARVWDAAKMAAKWRTNFSGAAGAWMSGINSLTQSPTQAAATPEAMAAYVNGVNASIQNGRRLAGLNRVDAATFKAACSAKQSHLATGAATGQAKIQAALQNLIPVWQSMRAASAAVGGGRGVNSVAKWTAAHNAQMAAAGKPA